MGAAREIPGGTHVPFCSGFTTGTAVLLTS
jgi:hypothetical protein